MGEMSLNEQSILRGQTLRVYQLLLKEKEPISIRGVQRKLEFSSSSVAAYHLNKLEDVGLVKQTPQGYVVEKVLLGDMIRLMRIFVPRFFFYAFFFLSALTLELTIYRETEISGEYVFHVMVSLFATLFLFYEGIRTWRKERSMIHATS